MIVAENIIKEDRFPDFIKNHNIFKQQEKFDKIFPKIGLANFTSKVSDIKPTINYIIKNSLKTGSFYYSEDSHTQDEIFVAKLIKTVAKPVKVILGCILQTLDNISNINLTKEFIKNCSNNLTLCFSSTGLDGAWDIATMSMRAISSCQSWEARQAKSLIGSIIDPCCGIIYLCNNSCETTEFGSDMLYRSVVRFVIHPKIGPFLFLERIYPYIELQYAYPIYTLFATELFKRSGLPVIFPFSFLNDEDLKSNIFIPHTKTIDKLPIQNWSYRDSKLTYLQLPKSYLMKFPLLNKINDLHLN